MHSLVRGAYALQNAWYRRSVVVSMHSLVRGAYAQLILPSCVPTTVSMHSLVRGAYAPPRPIYWQALAQTGFYALSRARCLCTWPA